MFNLNKKLVKKARIAPTADMVELSKKIAYNLLTNTDIQESIERYGGFERQFSMNGGKYTNNKRFVLTLAISANTDPKRNIGSIAAYTVINDMPCIMINWNLFEREVGKFDNMNECLDKISNIILHEAIHAVDPEVKENAKRWDDLNKRLESKDDTVKGLAEKEEKRRLKKKFSPERLKNLETMPEKIEENKKYYGDNAEIAAFSGSLVKYYIDNWKENGISLEKALSYLKMLIDNPPSTESFWKKYMPDVFKKHISYFYNQIIKEFGSQENTLDQKINDKKPKVDIQPIPVKEQPKENGIEETASIPFNLFKKSAR